MYILLVEDSPSDAELVRKNLDRAGISNDLRIVQDGAKALEFARAETPILMLLDFNLPGMDGLEVLKKMRANGKLRRLPVIVLSGSLREGDDIKAFELGAKEVLIKPLNTARLIEALLALGFTLRLEHPFLGL